MSSIRGSTVGVPFAINVPDDAVADLQRRLALTRWPDAIAASDWEYGTPLTVLHKVVDRWRDGFDWRKVEKKLNDLPQFQMEVDGQRVHYIHVRGADADSRPLILTHGWPGSFVEMCAIIPLLANPGGHGLPGWRSFDVVVPSLPGFGFSAAPKNPGMNARAIASILHRLMQALGYASYFAQGGDIGASVSSWMARLFPDAVRALHLNFIPGSYQPCLGADQRPVSAVESAWLDDRSQWLAKEGGYSHIQGTKPQTLAYSLVDSPAGLAAWIVEKFFAWSDGPADLLQRFAIDELLTNICVYWYSGNVAATLRIYKENASVPLRFAAGERIIAPLYYARFPKEILTPPRQWVERAYNVARWTEMPCGGHFAALEQPRLLARDIHESLAEFR